MAVIIGLGAAAGMSAACVAGAKIADALCK